VGSGRPYGGASVGAGILPLPASPVGALRCGRDTARTAGRPYRLPPSGAHGAVSRPRKPSGDATRRSFRVSVCGGDAEGV